MHKKPLNNNGDIQNNKLTNKILHILRFRLNLLILKELATPLLSTRYKHIKHNCNSLKPRFNQHNL